MPIHYVSKGPKGSFSYFPGSSGVAFSPFLDEFTTDDIPLSSTRTAEPGDGEWSVVNPSAFSVIDGWLRGGSVIGETVWGDQRMNGKDNAGAGLSRIAGRTLTTTFLSEDRGADWAIGFVTSPSITDPRIDGHSVICDTVGRAVVSTPGNKVTILDDNHVIRAQDYFVGITLDDQGSLYWISTYETDTGRGMTGPLSIPKYPIARIVYRTPVGVATPLYPSYYPLGTVDPTKQYYRGHALKPFRVSDPVVWSGIQDVLSLFADRFVRANNTATPGNGWLNDNGIFGIVGEALYHESGGSFPNTFQDTPGTSDGIFVWDFILNTDTQHAWPSFRRTSQNNFLRIGNNGTNNSVFLQQVVFVAGALSAINTIVSGPATWVAGRNTVVVSCSGNQYLIYVNNVLFTSSWVVDTNNYNIAGRGIGFMCFDSGTVASPKLNGCGVWPHTFTIPAEIQGHGDYLAPITPGAAVITDTFTGVNGTLLDGRATTTGGKVWSKIGSPIWTISNNRAQSDRTGEGLLWVLADSDDYEIEIQTTLPAAWNATQTMFVGVMLAGATVNDFVVVRQVADKINQPNEDELELVQWLSGASAIQHKAQMGPGVYSLLGVYTLRVQKIGLLVRTYLDNKPAMSYVLPSSLRFGRMVGGYQSNFDSACQIDNFSVKPLA